MDHPRRGALLIGFALILTLAVQKSAGSQSAGTRSPASAAVRSFYAFHLAHNKDFTVRNVQQRKRWLTPELYKLLLNELKRQAEESKAHPDEAPYFEGDPLTDSQEYPDSFRVGKTDVSGDQAKVTVTLMWSARTSRGRDKREIVVEVTKSGQAWLINDVINNEGSSLRDELKKQH
ncbi:MAG: DUF3828 domain-containing protein [Acidobacteriota bacterium]